MTRNKGGKCSIKLCPPPIKDMVDHPYKFLVHFLGCKWNARPVSHEAMH